MAAEDRQVVGLPRRWRFAVRALAPASERDGILLDLDEERAAVAASQGRRAASRFLRWQVVHSAGPWLARRGRDAAIDIRSGMTMAVRGIWSDVRIAARRLVQARGFSALAVVTLAIGIGAVSTVFSLAHALWLKPLPYHDPDRLVSMHARHDASGNAGSLTPAEFADYQRDWRSLSGVAGYMYGAGIAPVNGEPVRIVSHPASPNLFRVLGVRPALGRDFTDTDAGSPVVMLSDAMWRSHFGADPDVAGKTLTFDAQSYVVIGVMPRGFTFPRVLSADVWMPGDMTAARGDPSGRHVQTMARLAPGVTLDAAMAELQTRSRQIALASGATTSPWTMFLVPAGETTSASSRLAFQALLATVGLFLLVACANLAGLMLARNTARRAEFAVCLSIGASRWRLTRLLLIEALLLAGAGAVAGVLLAMSGARALAAVMPPRMPGLDAVGVNPTVAIVAVAAALVSALLIALLPAVRLRHLRPADALAGGRTIARGTVRAQRWLVAGEMALAVTLLAGGAAMLQSFSAAIHRDRGYLPEHLHALNVSLPFSDDSYLPIDRRARAFEDILARVGSVPGVRQVGATTGFPGSQLGILGASEIAIAGRSPLIAAIHSSSDSYFASMGIPIQAGRAFTRADSSHAAPVAIVNELLAREFPGGNPIGRHIPVGIFGETRQYEIVGVAGNIRLGDSIGYRVFVPLAQASPYWIDLVFRTDGRLGVAAEVRRALRDHSRDLLLENESSFQTIISDSLGLQRAQTTVVALVGGLSAVVAAIGIYALLTFLGTQRRRDMGIRIALGSPPGRLFRETFLGALRLVGAGAVIGIATAMLLVRVLGAQVFGLTSANAATHVAAAAVVLGVAVVAVWIPARRVMRIDPLIALRME